MSSDNLTPDGQPAKPDRPIPSYEEFRDLIVKSEFAAEIFEDRTLSPKDVWQHTLESLGFTCMSFLELVVEVEDVFEISIPGDFIHISKQQSFEKATRTLYEAVCNSWNSDTVAAGKATGASQLRASNGQVTSIQRSLSEFVESDIFALYARGLNVHVRFLRRALFNAVRQRPVQLLLHFPVQMLSANEPFHVKGDGEHTLDEVVVFVVSDKEVVMCRMKGTGVSDTSYPPRYLSLERRQSPDGSVEVALTHAYSGRVLWSATCRRGPEADLAMKLTGELITILEQIRD